MYYFMDQSVGGQLGWILPKAAVPLVWSPLLIRSTVQWLDHAGVDPCIAVCVRRSGSGVNAITQHQSTSSPPTSLSPSMWRGHGRWRIGGHFFSFLLIKGTAVCTANRGKIQSFFSPLSVSSLTDDLSSILVLLKPEPCIPYSIVLIHPKKRKATWQSLPSPAQ